MKSIHRRDFIKKSVNTAGGIIAAPAFIKNMITNSPNERVNIGLIGISGNRPRVRGMISGREGCICGKTLSGVSEADDWRTSITIFWKVICQQSWDILGLSPIVSDEN